MEVHLEELPCCPQLQTASRRYKLGRGAVQVKVNPEVKGIIVKGANVLPARLIEDLFRQQYGKPLKYPLCTAAVQGINAWYENQGYVGQVDRLSSSPFCIISCRLDCKLKGLLFVLEGNFFVNQSWEKVF